MNPFLKYNSMRFKCNPNQAHQDQEIKAGLPETSRQVC